MTRYVCSKMFTDLNIKFPNNIIKNCCKSNDYIMTDDEVKSDNIFITNKEYVRRKSSMLFDNELPKNGCDTCLNYKENSLFNTWNEWNIQGYDEHRDNNLITSEQFDLFEFMLSSACDLKCIYCHPKDSSSWAKELNVPVYKGSDKWKDTVLNQLYTLLERKVFNDDVNYFFFFSGGEPTYNPETIIMIEKMVSILSHKVKRLHFVISTNANTKETIFNRYIDLVKKYPNINWVFDCSIDGIGEVCEAIRHGIVWDRAIANMKIMMKQPNIKVRISPTVNLYSIPSMKEFVEYFVTLFEENNVIHEDMFNFNMAQEPAMSPAFLPTEYKQYLDKPIEICKNRNISFYKHLDQIKNIIGTDYTEDTKIKVKRQFDYFKEKRPATDWDKLFPHIVELVGE